MGEVEASIFLGNSLIGRWWDGGKRAGRPLGGTARKSGAGWGPCRCVWIRDYWG